MTPRRDATPEGSSTKIVRTRFLDSDSWRAARRSRMTRRNLSRRAAPLVGAFSFHGLSERFHSRREFDKNRTDAIFGQRQLARSAPVKDDQAQSLPARPTKCGAFLFHDSPRRDATPEGSSTKIVRTRFLDSDSWREARRSRMTRRNLSRRGRTQVGTLRFSRRQQRRDNRACRLCPPLPAGTPD